MRFRQSVWFKSLSTSHRHTYSRARRRAAIVLTLLSALQTPLVYSQQLVEQVGEKRKGDYSGGAGAQCVWVAAWAAGSESDGKGGLRSLQKQFDYERPLAVPGCFAKFWSSRCKGIDGRGARSERNGALVRYGACTIGGEGAVSMWGATAGTLADFLGVPDSIRELHRVRADSKSGYRMVDYRGLDPAQAIYWGMDSQCKYVTFDSSTRLCGFAGVSMSPISLIFDESSSLESDMTVVDLALDPNRPGSYSLWKGSDKAPLLVYDPERSGNVANATKLFGNYTFGGRTAELSRIKLGSRAERPTWSNGYEALGLLDKDHDGRVAGAELEALSLWFDKNRDAHSDAGEVKSLASLGITALYYQNPTGQAGSDDIGLDLGYERLVDGRVVQGRSVDWYGETFASKAEAAQALAAVISAQADRARLDLKRDWRSDPLGFSPRITKNHEANLSGFWRWHMVDDQDASNPGAFAFDQADDLSVRGFSIIESVLQKNPQDLHSGVTILPAEGKLEADAEGHRTLKLTVTNPENGSTAETTATLEENGFVLKGTTVQRYISSNEPNAKSATLTYEWVAQKFVDKSVVRQ